MKTISSRYVTEISWQLKDGSVIKHVGRPRQIDDTMSFIKRVSRPSPVPRDWYDSFNGRMFGHSRYCVQPGHNNSTYCSASEDEPWTLDGEPSLAWLRDNAVVVEITMKLLVPETTPEGDGHLLGR